MSQLIRPVAPRTAAAAALILRAARTYEYPGDGLTRQVQAAAALMQDAIQMKWELRRLEESDATQGGEDADGGALAEAKRWVGIVVERAMEVREEAAEAAEALRAAVAASKELVALQQTCEE
jgi:hypothetical protein